MLKAKLKTEPTIYDQFDIVNFIEKRERANLEARNNNQPLPHFGIHIPTDWQKKIKRWFYITDVTKCLRRAAYKALKYQGLPITYEQQRSMNAGSHAHSRLEKKFRAITVAIEMNLFDPIYGLRGRNDMLCRGPETGELFVADFKHTVEWFFNQIKRQGLPQHLKKTNFYPALPDDELQVMLYIRVARQLNLEVNFGLVIYENKNTGEFKSCLVEYNEIMMAKFFKHFQQMNDLLDENKLIEPYIPKEARIHLICPYRMICERGQDALIIEKKKRKNIPLWMIYQIKRKKQPLVIQPEEIKKIRQLKLFD